MGTGFKTGSLLKRDRSHGIISSFQISENSVKLLFDMRNYTEGNVKKTNLGA
jgi:hypothetical protein